MACNVTRNEICSQELLVVDVLALESRWLRTFVVGEMHSGCNYGCTVYHVPSTVDLSHSKPESTGKFRNSCNDKGQCKRDAKC